MSGKQASTMDALAAAILQALAEESGGAGMSLPRLGKRLGQNASVLVRALALMGDAAIGGVAGPGWTRLEQAEGRWVARLTPGGRAIAEGLRQAP